MAEDTENTEQEEQGEEQEAAPKKKKKKLPMMLILGTSQLVGTLALGGLIIWGLKGIDAPKLDHEDLAERAIASVRDHVENIRSLELEAFQTNTVTQNTIEARISIEVSDPHTLEFIERRMPVIRSRVLSELSQSNAQSLRRVQDKLRLKDQLREVMNHELRRQGLQNGVVREVFLMDLLII